MKQMKKLNEETMALGKWYKPKTVKQTLDLMRERPRYHIRNGGTGTYKKFLPPSEHDLVIDISGVQQLKNINMTNETLTIGAGVTFTELLGYLKTSGGGGITQELMRVISGLATPQVRPNNQFIINVLHFTILNELH